jgi:hypothetical protein
MAVIGVFIPAVMNIEEKRDGVTGSKDDALPEPSPGD